jgi:hypothetical protein
VCCAIRCYLKIVPSNIVRTVITKLWMRKNREVDDSRLSKVLHSGGQMETIEDLIRLFTIVTMVTKVRLGLFI